MARHAWRWYAEAMGLEPRIACAGTSLVESNRGVRASDLLDAAGQLGLLGRAYFARDLGAIDGVGVPAIVHLKRGHFVVLASSSMEEDRVEILDPAIGRMKAQWRLVGSGKHVSGIVITFETSGSMICQPAPRLEFLMDRLYAMFRVTYLRVQSWINFLAAGFRRPLSG